ncbi:IS6 family transposase [Pseudoruegeria sp. SK021]|nr:IS6 family transposase [Pseudoruegeria sp. SK021]
MVGSGCYCRRGPGRGDKCQRRALFKKTCSFLAVFFYVRYAVSYRDLEAIMAERGADVDHATLSRWVVKFSPMVAAESQRRTSATSRSWRIDETHIKVKGVWTYLYRAVDKRGRTLDFMLFEHRDEAAATGFFARALTNNGWPKKVVIDKSGANLAGLETLNWRLILQGWFWLIDICCVKYLNNIIKQDHRFIKARKRGSVRNAEKSSFRENRIRSII